MNPRHLDVRSVAQVHGRIKQVLIRCRCPEIELVSVRPAEEAAVVVLREIGRERATPLGGTMTDRTVAVYLLSLRGRPHESQQFEHLLHGHARSHRLKIDTRHRIAPDRRRGNPYSFCIL